ncbi:MAG: class I SAM-dependent methyltransferase [Geminicoccaceae bacterium]
MTGFEMLRRRRGESRSLDRLRAHYELEVQLARRLMNAPKAQRLSTYGAVYAELFAGVPDHPQRARRQTDERGHVDAQLRELHRHLGKAKVFLETGAGDCRLAFAVCAQVGRVVAVDVCDQLVNLEHAPENFSFALSDGTSIPVPPGSVDVAYSNQLMEHLHPEDALEQLANIHRALKPGSVYYCITPSRISGPHDISVYFESVSRGLHLKEYSYRELTELFRRAGFRRVAYRVPRLGGAVPRPLLSALEALLERVRGPWRPTLCQNAFASRLLGIHALAYR